MFQSSIEKSLFIHKPQAKMSILIKGKGRDFFFKKMRGGRAGGNNKESYKFSTEQNTNQVKCNIMLVDKMDLKH